MVHTNYLKLKVLNDNEFTDNKLYYYLKPTESPAPRFYGQPKNTQATSSYTSYCFI